MVTSTIHAAAAVLLSLAIMGTGQPAGDSPLILREPEAKREERMSVGAAMKLIAHSYDKLREQIADASKKDENLRLVNDMQRGAVSAKWQPVPAEILKHARDDAAKATIVDNYRKDLIALTRKLLDVETEIAAGKLDQAKALLEEATKLGDIAHGRFPQPEQE